MNMRVTVSGIIRNAKDEVLLCKMPSNRGVYPGQWAIPGGGIDDGEKMIEALRRELMEEVGLEVGEVEPISFSDDVRVKLMKDGTRKKLYMIHLIFDCKSLGDEVKINEEFDEYKWVTIEKLKEFDLNEATIKTFDKKSWI